MELNGDVINTAVRNSDYIYARINIEGDYENELSEFIDEDYNFNGDVSGMIDTIINLFKNDEDVIKEVDGMDTLEMGVIATVSRILNELKENKEANEYGR